MAKGNELKAKPSKKILVVSEELFHKIEESRGDLSRDEFISLCLDTLIEEESKA